MYVIQCDVVSSGIGDECRKLPWDSEQLMQLTIQKVLIEKINCVQKKMPTWTPEQQLQGTHNLISLSIDTVYVIDSFSAWMLSNTYNYIYISI